MIGQNISKWHDPFIKPEDNNQRELISKPIHFVLKTGQHCKGVYDEYLGVYCDETTKKKHNWKDLKYWRYD